MLGQAIPGFWLGLMLIYLFSVRLGWLPHRWDRGPVHYVMPVIVLGAFYAARMARLTRSSVLDTLGEDHILTARARGLAELVVVAKHTLKNAAIPIVTLAGLETGQLPGRRRHHRDHLRVAGGGAAHRAGAPQSRLPLVLAAVFVASLTYTLINLVVDLLYGWIGRGLNARVSLARVRPQRAGHHQAHLQPCHLTLCAFPSELTILSARLHLIHCRGFYRTTLPGFDDRRYIHLAVVDLAPHQPLNRILQCCSTTR